MGNANRYSGQIRHGEGGMQAPNSGSVAKTNRVHGKPQSDSALKAVDRAAGRPSTGNRTPALPKRGASGTRGSGE